jgi:3D (Asp-Asp-Asp) domain-containing protein
VAADPRVLPIGSIVRIMNPSEVAGTYSVLDTGARIKGRRLDVFMPSCRRAVRFGRKLVHLNVLRFGWHPQSPPRSTDRLNNRAR